MIYASLFIELIRARPRLVFWTAAVMQGLLWVLVPVLFYSAPPGDVAEVLAVGHQFRFGSDLGPPLAYWLAEIAFTAAGGSVFGVYLLAQICVVTAYWAVFALARSIVGESQGVLAVLLLVGVSTLTVATPDFGPDVAATPLWALATLFYWRAVEEERRIYWFALAAAIGLLLLTAYIGLVLAGLLIAFTLLTARGRAQLENFEPWAAGIVVIAILFPHLTWLDSAGLGGIPSFAQLFDGAAADNNLTVWLRMIGALLAANAGLALLVTLASKFWIFPREPAPEIDRTDIAPHARHFVYYFALMPALAMTFFATATGQASIVASPMLVLGGLAVIVSTKPRIHVHLQRLVVAAWFALLLAPPVFAAVSVVLAPWTIATELKVTQPMRQMSRFFTESFERRTGRPLAVVTGERELAALIALGAPQRPALYFENAPANSVSVSKAELMRKGGIIVWFATDLAGTPPADIKAQFPGLVPETPRAFARPIQGRMPLLRIGWAVIRPQGEAAAPGAPRPAPIPPRIIVPR